jgi:hypothetical protein
MENVNNKKNLYAALMAVVLLALIAGAVYYLRPAEVKAPAETPDADVSSVPASPITSSVPPERRQFEDEASILREFGIKIMNKDPEAVLYDDVVMNWNTESGPRELKGFGLNYWRETGDASLDEVYASLGAALADKGFAADEFNPDVSSEATTTVNFRRDNLVCGVSQVHAEKTADDHVAIECASCAQSLE